MGIHIILHHLTQPAHNLHRAFKHLLILIAQGLPQRPHQFAHNGNGLLGRALLLQHVFDDLFGDEVVGVFGLD